MNNFRWQLAVFLLGMTLVGVIYLAGQRAEGDTRPVTQTTAAGAEEAGEAVVQSPLLSSEEQCIAGGLVRGGVVSEGVVGRPNALNPLLADGNPVDEALTALVFDGLTALDDRGRVIPALAAGWNIADDGRTIVFTLKEGLTWHDGEPLTAADVAFTYTLLQDPLINNPLPDGATWRHLTVEALDDLTVRVILETPFSPFLQAATRGILPAHQLEGVTAAALAAHPFNEQPIGSGPFWVTNRWTEDGYLLLAPVLPQWSTRPLLDRLQIRFYADDQALLNAFASGDIQLTGPLPPNLVPEILKVEQTALVTGYQPALTQLVFNVTAQAPPAVQDVAVRRALAQLIDRDSLVESRLNGQGIPLVGPFLHESWVNIPQHPPLIPSAGRQTAAAGLLDAAGWLLSSESEGENPANRRLGDDELAFSLLVPDDPALMAVANGVVEQWAAAGGTFVVEAVPFATYRQRLQDRQFGAAVVELSMIAGPDLYDFWSQESIVRGQNFAGWNHRRASEALEAGRQTWPEESRRQFYQAFWELFQNDLPAVTLYQQMTVFAYNATIEGFEAGPVYRERDRLGSFDRWSLPQNRATAECQEE